MSDQKELATPEEFVAYRWRFLVLLSFSSFTFIQSYGWLGFGAYSAQTVQFFGWETDQWISWYLFLGPVCFVVAAPLFLWMIDARGLRMSCRFGSALNLVGVLFKLPCLWMPNESVAGWALVLVGQGLACGAGTGAMAIPSKLSSVWFPPKERSVATAVAVISNTLGTAAAFLTSLATRDSSPFACLQFQLYLQLGLAVASTLSVFLCVRDSPPTASSKATDRDVSSVPILPELRRLCCNAPFVFVVVAAGFSQGKKKPDKCVRG